MIQFVAITPQARRQHDFFRFSRYTPCPSTNAALFTPYEYTTKLDALFSRTCLECGQISAPLDMSIISGHSDFTKIRRAHVVLGMVAAWLCAAAHSATAHPLDLGYLRVQSAEQQIDVQLDLDRNAAAIVLGIAPETLDAATVHARGAALAERTFARSPVTSGAGPCRWAGATADLHGETVTIASSTTCLDQGSRRWTFPFVAEHAVSPRFQLMVKETGAGGERLTLIDDATTDIELATLGSSSTGFSHFVWSGFEHIGVAPSQWRTERGGLQLPDGIDHILFLLALMLSGGTLLQLLAIATGFTLGHSITLALSVLDVVRPPASVIEPLIALSIALAAAEAFVNRWRTHRWKIAASFGLIHGFGFATALSHLTLTTRAKVSALFGFNLGIELGQVVVVIAVAPIVIFAHRRDSKIAIRTAAAMIFACGLYWFVRRLIT